MIRNNSWDRRISHAFITSLPRHLHTVYVVRFSVRTRIPVVFMANIQWEGLSGDFHDGRFVHIVPNAIHTNALNKLLV